MATRISNSKADLLTVPNIEEHPPSLPEAEFTSQINTLLEQGVMHGYAKDFVTGQIDELSKQNPDLAEKYSLNEQSIKAGVERIYSMGSGPMPLALGQSTRFEVFSGVIARNSNQMQNQRDLSEDDKAAMLRIKRDVIIGATLAAGAAGIASQGVKTLARKAFETGISATATPRGQEIILDTIDCTSSLIKDSPPPTTSKGMLCYGSNAIYQWIKVNE